MRGVALVWLLALAYRRFVFPPVKVEDNMANKGDGVEKQANLQKQSH